MILKSKQSLLLDNWFQVHQFHRTGLASHKYYKHKQMVSLQTNTTL